ncbi:hypothetical protein DOTSEDRAFT_74037 [Dothistroma septosporum NZE10]|uniref:Uncharacterized protein n=1 Tax=Dothistroma septosporum (strain NZE10 / CBS 128990) TaxID=675120 RepID=N1PGU2_DOTSN|nr:hypothetical protein DOTSEDRAFT_74037 [Dothistroma septosporum NZE10]
MSRADGRRRNRSPPCWGVWGMRPRRRDLKLARSCYPEGKTCSTSVWKATDRSISRRRDTKVGDGQVEQGNELLVTLSPAHVETRLATR